MRIKTTKAWSIKFLQKYFCWKFAEFPYMLIAKGKSNIRCQNHQSMIN